MRLLVASDDPAKKERAAVRSLDQGAPNRKICQFRLPALSRHPRRASEAPGPRRTECEHPYTNGRSTRFSRCEKLLTKDGVAELGSQSLHLAVLSFDFSIQSFLILVVVGEGGVNLGQREVGMLEVHL